MTLSQAYAFDTLPESFSAFEHLNIMQLDVLLFIFRVHDVIWRKQVLSVYKLVSRLDPSAHFLCIVFEHIWKSGKLNFENISHHQFPDE